MNAPAPAPNRAGIIAVLIGLIAAIIAAVVLVVGRDDPADDATYRPRTFADEPATPTSPTSPRIIPVPRAAPAPPGVVAPPPAPVAPEANARGSGAEASELLLLARRVENTDPQRARQLLRQVLEINPQDEAALDALSKKMFLDEDHTAAKALLDRCLAAHPDSAGCKTLAAQIPDQATRDALEQKARSCIAATPDDTECMGILANGAFMDGKKEAAALIALRMFNVAPTSPTATLAIARVKARDGSYREARDLFDKACAGGNSAACFRANLLRSEGW